MPDESTIAGRLRGYIGGTEKHTMSIRRFAEVMWEYEPRPRGSTRAMIHRYLKVDGHEPPLSFLRVAAKVLGIRLEWLINGGGERTQERQDLGRERELGIKRAVLDGLGCPPPAEEDHIPFWVHPLLEVYVRGILPMGPDKLDPSTIEDEKEKYGAPRMVWISGSHHAEQFETLGKVLRAPLEALEIDAEDMEKEARDAYIFDMAQTLLGLAAAESLQRQRRKLLWNALDTAEEEGESDV